MKLKPNILNLARDELAEWFNANGIILETIKGEWEETDDTV